MDLKRVKELATHYLEKRYSLIESPAYLSLDFDIKCNSMPLTEEFYPDDPILQRAYTTWITNSFDLIAMEEINNFESCITDNQFLGKFVKSVQQVGRSGGHLIITLEENPLTLFEEIKELRNKMEYNEDEMVATSESDTKSLQIENSEKEEGIAVIAKRLIDLGEVIEKLEKIVTEDLANFQTKEYWENQFEMWYGFEITYLKVHCHYQKEGLFYTTEMETHKDFIDGYEDLISKKFWKEAKKRHGKLKSIAWEKPTITVEYTGEEDGKEPV